MTPTEAAAYRAQIARLGLSQEGSARILGVNARTSRRWALDERAIPEPWNACFGRANSTPS